MKRSFLSLFLAMSVSALVLQISSCKKEDTPPEIVRPLNDNSLPSAGVAQVILVSKSGNTLNYSIDVCVFRDSKNLEDQLKTESFKNDTASISGVPYYFTLQRSDLTHGNSAGPYSALMLMDQSGSILNTDPSDDRIDAAKAFCANLQQGDNVSLWSFAGSSSYYRSDVVQHTANFTTDGSSVLPYLDALNGKEDGNTPLYFSQDRVINYCDANAPLSNKAVLTFTDGMDNGQDNGYYTTMENVINHARQKNIRLYNIGLDQAEIQKLCNEATATGGAFMFAKNARQLISMFGNLGKLLNKTATYYHTVWQVTKSSGSFPASGNLAHQIRITLPYGGEIIVPFNLNY